jgi:hypothetical protein
MASVHASTRAQVLDSLDIRRGDFVVEVGGGHEPFHRSDLNIDKYPFDNLHRLYGIVYHAPTVIADAARLPLPSRGCDWIFASHLIEHLPRPELFVEEIQRCSDRVYLEFPALNRELMFAWACHEWLVVPDGSHLVFYRNDIPQLFGDFFHANYDYLLDAWAMQRHRDLNAHVTCESEALTWEFAEIGAFEHAAGLSATGQDRLIRAPERPVRYTARQLAVLVAQRSLPDRLLKRLERGVRARRAGEPKRVTEDLIDRLACVRCGASELELTPRAERAVCRACATEYGRRGGLLDFDVSSDAPVPAGEPTAAATR